MKGTLLLLSSLLVALPKVAFCQTVVQNPTTSQTINQPAGTTFNVNGIDTLLWPNAFRIANEGGNQLVFRDMTQTDAWFMMMRNDGNSTGDIQFFGNFGNAGILIPNGTDRGALGTQTNFWHSAAINILFKGGSAFRIDHPLDPLHKYLQHSVVESPDMKNVYDGVAQLDERGECWVSLPDWFEALNSDFRYQLTPIGRPAPNLFVAVEIAHNKFKIAGGKPGAKVSWQVTGIRQDAFAKANRIKVEMLKPPELQGKYLRPQLFNQQQDHTEIAREQNQLINPEPVHAENGPSSKRTETQFGPN